MILTNISRTTINDKYEGHYVTMTDNTQMNPATNFTSILNHWSVNENVSDLSLRVPNSRRNFTLSGTPTSNDDSVSELLENIPGFDISGDEFDDTMILGLFKLKTSLFSTDVLKLDYVLGETYMGSLDSYRKLQSPGGGNPTTFFIGDIEDGSPNIELFVNKNISYATGTWMASAGTSPIKKVRFLSEQLLLDSLNKDLSGNGGVPVAAFEDMARQVYDAGDRNTDDVSPLSSKGVDALIPLGSYQVSQPDDKQIGSVPDKLERIFRTIENLDLVNIDISVEAGLGTIFSGAKWNITYGNELTRGDTFDDEIVVDVGTINHGDDASTDGFYQIRDNATFSTQHTAIRDNYRAVLTKFNDFAEFNRKDHIHIADAPRWLFVNGINLKAMDDKRRTFTQAVYWPMRHIYSHLSSSYSCIFGNWASMHRLDLLAVDSVAHWISQ